MEITFDQSAYDWWELIPAIVGGIIGAFAGGIPAWLLARRASKETLLRDRLSREEAELAKVYSAHTKLGVMVNDLVTTVLLVRDMMTRPVDPRDESPTQRRVSAVAGKQLRPELLFSPDDLAIFIAANQPDYLSELDLFSRRYAADMNVLETYGVLKAELHNLISDCPEIRFGRGDAVSTPSTGPTANKLRMKARTLESVIVPLIEMMERDARHGMELAKRFDTVLKGHFPNRKVPGFQFERDIEAAFSAPPIGN
ncbi:MAG: hypothetical protein JNJ92_06170 [Altererythrobacter sp.]|nr:hypothetical protein [Altererythrobacter sp.]